MSKNIKGKSLDINFNITQAGTFNADIFNAYEDFTLDGISIVSRITELELNKQDLITAETDLSTGDININDNKILSTSGDLMINASIARIDANVVLVKDTIVCNGNTIVNNNLIVGGVLNADVFPNLLAGEGIIIEDGSTEGVPARKSRISLDLKQSITPSSTAVASCDAIIAYVGGITPTITATEPLQYEGGVISASFDDIPTISSINLLSSGSIYNRFLLYQPLITEYTTLHTGFITTGGLQSSGLVSAVAGFVQNGINLLQQINTKQNIITPSTDLAVNSIDINTLTGNAITITGSNGRIDCGLVMAATVVVSGPIIANENIITNGADIRANGGNIIGVKLLGDIFDNLLPGGGILIETGGDLPVGKTKISISIPLEQVITANTESVASSNAIINYVASAIPSLEATAPLEYEDGVISASFDTIPTSGSINLINSGTLFNRFQLYQPLITEYTTLNTGYINTGGLESSGLVQAAAGLWTGATVKGGNFLQGDINLLDEINTKQNIITTSTNLELGGIIANGSIQTTGAFIATGNIISNGSNVIGEKLFGDIYTNLVAGEGIVLENDTVDGVPAYKTRISATALSTSTQYAFQATGNGNDISVSAGQKVPFNVRQIVVPNLSDYDAPNQRYDIQVAGLYQFGFNVFQRAQVEQFRLGIYKSGLLQGMGGMTQSQTESLVVMVQCVVGDYIDVRCVVGSAPIYMGSSHSWFYGSLLQPKNNTVSVETDLTVASITAETINGNLNKNLISNRFDTEPQFVGNFTVYMPDFRSSNYLSAYGTYINPTTATNTGDDDKGFIVNTAGFYRVEYSINFENFGFGDRAIVLSQIYRKNALILHGNSYCYPRHQNYATFGTCNGSAVFECAIGDNIDIRCFLNKSDQKGFNSNWMGLRGYNGSSQTITYLGT